MFHSVFVLAGGGLTMFFWSTILIVWPYQCFQTYKSSFPVSRNTSRRVCDELIEKSRKKNFEIPKIGNFPCISKQRILQYFVNKIPCQNNFLSISFSAPKIAKKWFFWKKKIFFEFLENRQTVSKIIKIAKKLHKNI